MRYRTNLTSHVPSAYWRETLVRLIVTPLRGPEIARILKTDFGWIVISVYGCGAADARTVRRQPLTLVLSFNVA